MEKQVPSTTVVVNQVATRGPNKTRDEFIELRNISVVPHTIGNWQLVACNPDGSEVLLATIPAGTVMARKGQVGQFFLVANADGYSAAIPPDLTYSGVEIQDLGGVRLRDHAGARIDGVGFTNGLACTETARALAQVEADDPKALANSRDVASADTDVNQIDFRQLPRHPRNRFS